MITNTKPKPTPGLIMSCHHGGVLTVEAGIKVPSAENPELSKVLPLKPTLGQTIAIPAFLTARNSGFIPSVFPVH